VDISFDATVWSPKLGSRLHGTISISSPDHIALLVHGTFNVSIPRHHIPSDKSVFEYGPSENDPEFGPNAAMALDEAQQGEEQEDQEENGGRWVDKITGKPLGGKRKGVKFTVIG
jgi:DNA-directed RNA polymerase I subunit RPA43